MTTRAASKGGRGKCTICASPDRAAIDRALVGGTSAAQVAARFGVNESSVKRHRRSHTPIELQNVHVDEPDISPSATALDVPAEMLQQFRRSEAALKAAQTGGGHLSVNVALREHRQTLEAIARWNADQARLAAMNRTDEVIDILTTGQWLLIRGVITRAMDHFPEQRLWIADALHKIEQEAQRNANQRTGA